MSTGLLCLVLSAFLLSLNVDVGTSDENDVRDGYMLIFHEDTDLALAAKNNSCYFVSIADLKMNSSASLQDREDELLKVLNGTTPSHVTLSNSSVIHREFHYQFADILCNGKQLFDVTILSSNATTAPAAITPFDLNCTFEHGLCGWSQGHADDLDWTVGQGSTTTRDTGPGADHTLNTDQGHYMFIESTGTAPGEVARLLSPFFTVTFPVCLTFWYSMYGENVDTLTLLQKTSTGNKSELWQMSGNQGQGWHKTQITLTPSGSPTAVIFKASTGRSVLSDIAIDDVDVSPQACPTPSVSGCVSSPCLNGGKCLELDANDYTCACMPGFTGKTCDSDIDNCSPNPCHNGGTCRDSVNSYSCSCPHGYAGGQCQTDVDDCSPHPCQNGGTCQDGVSSYTCTCPPGYTGHHCETDVDDCFSNPCHNGGTCQDGVNSYTCTCPLGYTGDQCHIDIDDCSPNPCHNGGTCQDGVNSYTCTCPHGYTGDQCQTDVCSPHPCLHGGTCHKIFTFYTCSCPPGYTGYHCETDIDDCPPNPCHHGGTCRDGVNSYACDCAPGYTGDHCETDFDECSSNPCHQEAQCYDDINSFICICPLGFIGHSCIADVDDCSPNPCHNGGTCQDGGNYYTCTCPPGYTGHQCQTDIDDCTPNPCHHGGTCQDGVNSNTCKCERGYSGDQCQTDIDDCIDNTCHHGATCQDGVHSYTCICPPGYTGHRCNIDVQDCRPDLCHHGGTCHDGLNSYTCTCAHGYTGDHCQIEPAGTESDCEDRQEDCSVFECCGRYTDYARSHCAKTCAYCKVHPPEHCENKAINCHEYDREHQCNIPNYRDFCRHYCNACNVNWFSPICFPELN